MNYQAPCYTITIFIKSVGFLLQLTTKGVSVAVVISKSNAALLKKELQEIHDELDNFERSLAHKYKTLTSNDSNEDQNNVE